MSKKIIDLGFGTPSDTSLGFIGDPSSGALSKATFLTFKNYFQSGSSLSTGSFVNTASFNAFSASYHNDSASFYLTINNVKTSQSNYVLTSSYLPFSSSYSIDSGSFDSRIKAISGSFNTGSFVTVLNFNVFSGSVASNFSSSANQIINVYASESNYVLTSSFLPFSSSYHNDSGSNYTKIINVYASESNYVLTSSYLPFSSSYVNDSSSFNVNIFNTYLSSSKYLLTSSVNGNNNYIAVYSGSQGLVFGTIYQSGSSVLINAVNGIPGVALQVNGPIYQNDTSYTRIAAGTTLQRPTGSFGMIRMNSDTLLAEYFNGASWIPFGSGSGSPVTGSVTSVGLSLPSIFNVSNSPIVGAGVLSGSFNTQSTNLFFASPSASSGVPSFRALAISDIAALTSSFIGNFVLTSSFNTFSSSYVGDSGSFNTRINNVYASESGYTPTSSFNTLSSSFSTTSGSLLNIIINVYASESNYVLTSSYLPFSSSYVNDSSSFKSTIANVYASESIYLPSSSVRGITNFIPIFSGITTLTSSVIFQSGSSVIIGGSTGSNAAGTQIIGGLSVSGSLYDSFNSTGSQGQILSAGLSGLVWSSTGSGFWNLSGNSISSGSFLGTTNTQDLIFKRNNIQMGLFTSNNSIALGNANNIVSGSNSIVLGGSGNISNTMASVLGGGNNVALGNSSVIVGGQFNISIGLASVALGGTNLSSSAAYGITIGRFNDPITGSSTTTWIATDPLFIAGNGSSSSSLSNAFVLYKNGLLSLPGYNTFQSSFLTSDNFGNVTGTPIIGQNGYIPMFSGSTALSSSRISQSGSVLYLSGSIIQSNANFVSGSFASAFGAATRATGNFSLAQGTTTTASGQGSHAEGDSTQAIGINSHAEGDGTVSSGVYSHAEGQGSVAVGDHSHADGIGTVASGSGQGVVGKYNAANTSSLFIIGNGTSMSASQRTNLIEFNSQSIYAYQDVYISSSLHISQSIYDSFGGVGTVGQLLSSTVTGVQWITTSGSAIFSGFVTTGSFNIFSASYVADSSSFNTRINAISSSILNLTGSYVTTNIFNPYTASVTTLGLNIFASQSNYVLTSSYLPFSSSYVLDSGSFNTRINIHTTQIGNLNTFSASILSYTGSINTQILNVYASESNYLLTSSLRGVVNSLALFSGSNSLSSSLVFQSGSGTGSAILVGNTTGSRNAILQVFGNIYISKSIVDSANSTGSVNQVLTQTGTGVLWASTGSGGTNVFSLNFIVGDGQSFTPSASSTQLSSSTNPLVGKTVLQFFEEGNLLAPVSRSYANYSFTSSNGIINLNNASFDPDTFYSILYK